MKKTLFASRLLLGLTFVVFGLDGLFHFFPMPPMPAGATVFLNALIASRLFYVVKAIEITSGILLLSNRYVTAAIFMLAPIIFNIVWFDALLDPSSLPVGLMLVVFESLLLWSRRAALLPLFSVTHESVDPGLCPNGTR